MFDLRQPDQFKKRVRASFDTTTSKYGTNNDFHWQFAARLISHAPLQVGQTIIDVATGTAPAAILAAPIIGETGLIVGVDISSGILRLARSNCHNARIPNIVLVCGDAESIPFQRKCVDGLLCSSAIVWFPDIPRALYNWYQILRPKGWIAFSCFGGLARKTVIGLLGRLLKPYGQLLPELNAPLNTPENVDHCCSALDIPALQYIESKNSSCLSMQKIFLPGHGRRGLGSILPSRQSNMAIFALIF
jgi:ubiquinone/menaquinone biosynthesis C-methylase UbiE